MFDDNNFLALNKAAGLTDIQGYNGLAQMYYTGQGVDKVDHQLTILYYTKSANLGDSFGAFNLAALYDEYEMYEEAREWYIKAFELGDSTAMYNLGLLYSNGQGFPQSYQNALSCYEKAAELDDVNAIYNIGVLNLEGLGMQPNPEKALQYFIRASNLGHSNGQAAYNAGIIYLENKNNPEEAYTWFKVAEKLGLQESQQVMRYIENQFKS